MMPLPLYHGFPQVVLLPVPHTMEPMEAHSRTRIQEKQPPGFTDLSPETVVEILRWLPYLYIVRCRSLSRAFRDVIDQSWPLRLIIELGAAGYRRSDAIVPTRVALEKFRDFQKIYRNSKVHRGDRVDLKRLVSKAHKKRDPELYEHTEWRQRGEYMVGDTFQEDAKLVDVLWLGSDPQGRVSMAGRFHTLVFGRSWEVSIVEPNEDLLIMRDEEREYYEPHSFRFVKLSTGVNHPKRPGGSLAIDSAGQVHSVSGEWMLYTSNMLPNGQIRSSLCLLHWSSGQVVKAWSEPDYTMNAFNHGCLIDEHVFIPRWNEVDDTGLKASIEVWSVPSGPAADVRHLATFEVITFGKTAPKDRYFNLTPAQEDPSSSKAQRGFYPAQAILSIWLSKDGLQFFVPISTFLPEGDIYGPDEQQRGPPIILWERWGPKRAYIVTGLPARDDYNAITGLKIIYPEMIVDLNRLDTMANIYGFAPKPGSRGGKGTVDESYVTNGLIGKPEEHMPELGERPEYRVVPFRRRGSSLHFIEEDDGPKIVEISWASYMIPSSMRFWPITKF